MDGLQRPPADGYVRIFFRINGYVCMMAAPAGQKYFPNDSFALGACPLASFDRVTIALG